MRHEKYPKDMRMTLKTARLISGFSQVEAAEHIGITPETIRNYEKGRSFPDIPILRRIEEVYSVEYRQLIFLPIDFG